MPSSVDLSRNTSLPHYLSSDASHCQQLLLMYGKEHQYEDTSRHRPFRVTFYMTKEYGGLACIHLDALLSYGVVLDAVKRVPLPSSNVPYTIPLPLERLWEEADRSLLFHSTSLFPAGPVIKGVSYWIKRNNSMGPRFARRKMNGDEWQPDNGSGTHREYLTALPTHFTRMLYGYGIGNLTEVTRLLSFISEVGKKRSQGLGQISHFEVEPYTPPSRYVFLQDNTLLRPVPHEALIALGYQPSDPSTMQLIAYTPPYWHIANKTMGYPEKTRVEPREPNALISFQSQHWSNADFLLFCERKEAWKKVERGKPIDITLSHAKLQRGKGQGALCALSGLPISEEGAVAIRDVLKGSMGNVVDFLRAPGSGWVSHTSALVLSQQRVFHRSFVALVSPDEQDALLLWPTFAVDPLQPLQDRPLWREVLIALTDQYCGYRCLILCKDEPKSRLWPRARQGRIGAMTPIYFSDGELSHADLLHIDVQEAKRQLLLIESWLDAGYSRTSIRTGALVAPAHRLSETLAIQKEVKAMHQTTEFLLAWRFARFRQEREKREGTK